MAPLPETATQHLPSQEHMKTPAKHVPFLDIDAEEPSPAKAKNTSYRIERPTGDAILATQVEAIASSRNVQIDMDVTDSPKVQKRLNETTKDVEEPVSKALKEEQSDKDPEPPAFQFKRRQSKKIIPKKFDCEPPPKAAQPSESLGAKTNEKNIEGTMLKKDTSLEIEPTELNVPSIAVTNFEPNDLVVDIETKDKHVRRKIKVKKATGTKKAAPIETQKSETDINIKSVEESTTAVNYPSSNADSDMPYDTTPTNVSDEGDAPIDDVDVLNRKDLTDKERLVISEVMRTRKSSADRDIGTDKSEANNIAKDSSKEKDVNSTGLEYREVTSGSKSMAEPKELHNKQARKTDSFEVRDKNGHCAQEESNIGTSNLNNHDSSEDSASFRRKKGKKLTEDQDRMSGSFDIPDINIADLTVEHVLEALGTKKFHN